MANYVRCIKFSNESGSKEGVIFTRDFEAEESEFIPYGCTLDAVSEDLKEFDFPDAFPFDSILWRE